MSSDVIPFSIEPI